MLATDVIREGGANIYGRPLSGSRTTPLWMQVIARERRVASIQVLHGSREVDEVSVYEEMKQSLRASDGLSWDFDDASRTARITPTRGLEFMRRAGFAGNANITEAIILYGSSHSTTSTLTLPTLVAPSVYLWLWLGRPGATIERAIVSDVDGGDPANITLNLGGPAVMEVSGQLGSLYVSRAQMQTSQLSGKLLRIE